MTEQICKYCNQSHHNVKHETVCDNVKHPLYINNTTDQELNALATRYFEEKIKELKNDYMMLNTLKEKAIKDLRSAKTDLQNITKELKIAKAENYRLKNPNHKEIE